MAAPGFFIWKRGFEGSGFRGSSIKGSKLNSGVSSRKRARPEIINGIEASIDVVLISRYNEIGVHCYLISVLSLV